MSFSRFDKFSYGIVDPEHTRRKEFPDSTALTIINNFNLNNNGTLSKRTGLKVLLELPNDGEYRINEFDLNSVLLVNKFNDDYTFQIVAIRGSGGTAPVQDNTYSFDLSLLRFFKAEEGVILFDGIVPELILVKDDATLEIYPTSTLKPQYIKSITLHQSSLVLLGKTDDQEKWVMSVSEPDDWRAYETGTGEAAKSFQLRFSKKIGQDFYNIISFNSLLVVSTNFSFFSIVSRNVNEIAITNDAISVQFANLGSSDREMSQINQFLFYIAKDEKTLHVKSIIRASILPQFIDEDYVLKPQYTFKNEIFRTIQSRNYQTAEIFMVVEGEVYRLTKAPLNYSETGVTFHLSKFISSDEMKVIDMAMVSFDTESMLVSFGESKFLVYMDRLNAPVYMDLYKTQDQVLTEMTITEEVVTTSVPTFRAEDAIYQSLIVSEDKQMQYVIKTFISDQEVLLDEIVPTTTENFYLSPRYVEDIHFLEKSVQGIESETGAFLGSAVSDSAGLIILARNFLQLTYGCPITAILETGYITGQGEIGMKTTIQRIVVQDLVFEPEFDRLGVVINGYETIYAKGIYEFQYHYGYSTNEPINITVSDRYPFALNIDSIDVTYEIKTF